MTRKQIVWTYWFATGILLAAYFVGNWTDAIYAVITLAALQAAHFLVLDRRLMSFPVQVRVAYVLWTTAGLWEPLFFFHWIQFAGTWAVVTVGVCPLARMLLLMPWNRDEKLSFGFVWALITTPPVNGSIRDHTAKAV